VVKRLLLLLVFFCSAARAQDLTGTWRGSHGGRQVVLSVARRGNGFSGQLYNVGQETSGFPRNGNPVSSILLKGGIVSFTLDRSGETFQGALSGPAITGSWKGAGPAEPMTLQHAAAGSARPVDPSPYKTLFVPVDKDVKLEVLDWGGSGRALVFIGGLGDTAHIFDDFAPQFTGKYHVYGVTRRGLGLSDWPAATEANYNADRLADDVLAVFASLKLEKPVLVAHSLGGEVASSIGSRAPGKVAGLIYLDATFSYAWYDPKGDSTDVDYALLMRDLKLLPGAGPARGRELAAGARKTWPEFNRDLTVFLNEEDGAPQAPAPLDSPMMRVESAVIAGEQRYSSLGAPVLAIIALPHACAPDCGKPYIKATLAAETAQANTFAKDNPSAKVVRLPYAKHDIFRSNPADVLREMNAFLARLP
jgi:pimeloyl-ACP methyl ester carboxylesterase